MCLAQGPQHSDAGEAQTRGLLVSSQALYHWATALPKPFCSLMACPMYIDTTSLGLANVQFKRLKCMMYFCP